MQFSEEVLPIHFSTLRRTPFPHVQIEQRLVQIGGGGNDGMGFRKLVLNAAGWPHDGLTPFAKYPDQAAAAFNRVRLVLEEDSGKESLLASLGK